MRYVDADKLYPDCMTKDGKLAISQSQLANAPTVPQGEWQFITHHARRYRICPFCKCEKEDDRSVGWFYCWHCGAKMKGGEEE